jgi:hypothetical protein
MLPNFDPRHETRASVGAKCNEISPAIAEASKPVDRCHHNLKFTSKRESWAMDEDDNSTNRIEIWFSSS